MLPLSVTVVAPEMREKVLFMALYVMAVGEGGHKPCVMTFAADQFGEANAQEKAAKTSFFNYWYLAIVLASSIAVLALIFIQVIFLLFYHQNINLLWLSFICISNQNINFFYLILLVSIINHVIKL